MKAKRRPLRLILLLLLLILVALQFVPVDRSVPEYDATQDFVAVERPSVQVAALLQQACYDCHSYETEYPWYSYVAPVSIWLQGHVKGGRKHLNYSVWSSYPLEKQEHKVEEMIEMIEEKSMPLKSFTWAHPEARLSDAQRAEMTDWLKKVWVRYGGGQYNEEEMEKEHEEHEGHEH